MVTRFRSSGFDILAIPGTRSRALDIESPEVAKRDIPLELGCGHGGNGHMDRDVGQGLVADLVHFDILAFRGSQN